MNTKIFAELSVTVILLSSCGVLLITENEESDGFPPVIIVGLLVSYGVGAGAVGWALNDYFDSSDGDVQSYLRLSAANNITDMMSVATTFTTNSNSNYAQLWAMTKEHWIRQAELGAYADWESGTVFEANKILAETRNYENDAVMTANAVAQFNSFLTELCDKISAWKDTDTYAGRMDVGFELDNVFLSTDGDEIGAALVSVADSTGRGGKVYIGSVDEGYIVTAEEYDPAYIYNFGAPTVITNENGLSYEIGYGKVSLDGLISTVGNRPFEAGIYTITDAVIGGDTLVSVVGQDRILLRAGMAVTADGMTGAAYLVEGRISCMGNLYDTVSYKVVPHDIPSGEIGPDRVGMTDMLNAYQSLLDGMYWTSVSAGSAANAVWDIYDRADARQYGVTTLMVSNVYDSVVLSAGMNEILTLSAMQQLAEYYNSNDSVKGLEISLYGDGMDAPFVRGSIVDTYGNTVYEDVVFTPFFQSDDTVLERGIDYSVGQNTLVAVWTEGQELSSWYNSGMNTDGYETLFIEDGYTFRISQLASCDSDGMHNCTSLEFKVTKVGYIEPGAVNPSDDSDSKDANRNIISLVCIIIGASAAIFGLYRRDYLSVIGGIAVIVFGVFVADSLFDWIGRWLN